MKNSLLFAMAILLGLACSCKNTSKLSDTDLVHFSWFEYQGYDPVYESLEPADNEYLNPILSGYYPDPSIEKVGEDYYLVNSSFAHFPGIPIFHSTDLVNWTQLGHVLDRPEQAPFDSIGISRGVFAPAISHYNGMFYLVCTFVDCGGNFVVTAEDPAGPWSDPKFIEFEGIDPSIFFDEDGKAYIVNNGAPEGEAEYQGHRAIWIQEFDYENLEMVGPRKVLVNGGADFSKKPIWIEGPHIYRIKDYYYLCSAEGGTSIDHSQVIFRSKDVWGPFIPWEGNPILTQRHLDISRPNPVTCTGHLDMVETQNGEWWAVFLACTPYEKNFYNTGRQTFLLPVTWENDWPVVLKNDAEVPFIHEKPDLPAGQKSPFPLNGNFSYRDDFKDTTLSLMYTFVRTPREKWYSLDQEGLKLQARPHAIYELSQPSFIARRQQHHFCSASTSVSVSAKEGLETGLVVFQNEKNYYFVGVEYTQGQYSVKLDKGGPAGPETLKSLNIDLKPEQKIDFKIDARGKYYDFYYTIKPGSWELLEADIDAKHLSTDIAGGFVGSIIGMYAYAPE